MSTPPSPGELRDLVAEAVAVEYLKYRKDASPPSRPKWLQLFESAGFVTVITVLVGGIAGSYITTTMQNKAKEREQQAAVLQIQHDRELASFNEHLDRERKIVDEMLSRLGGLVDSSRNLAELSREEWSEENKAPEERQRLARQKHEVVAKYNQATTDWDGNRLRLGLLLQLEHDNDAELFKAWRKTGEAAEAYSTCCDRWRMTRTKVPAHEAQGACGSFRNELDETVKVFTDRLVTLRSTAVSMGSAPVAQK
jgi:hypothetical protein